MLSCLLMRRMSCDGDDDEYTNLCNLGFLLFLFIYSSLSISFSFLPYLTIPLSSFSCHCSRNEYRWSEAGRSTLIHSLAVDSSKAQGVDRGNNGTNHTRRLVNTVRRSLSPSPAYYCPSSSDYYGGDEYTNLSSSCGSVQPYAYHSHHCPTSYSFISNPPLPPSSTGL